MAVPTYILPRQGDVLLVRRSSLPEGSIDITPADGAVVLALGEVTGHKHRLHGAVKQYAKGEQRFVVIENMPAELVHEEHATAVLAPGVYETRDAEGHGIVQVEYTPDALRNVAD